MPKTKEQNEAIRNERIEQIQKEAVILFSKKGLSGTKIQDIANELGIAQGLIYHYYNSKEALYTDIVKISLDKMNTAAVSLGEMNISAKEKIAFAFKQLFHTIDSSGSFNQICQLITEASNSEAVPEEVKSEIKEKRKRAFEEISKIMLQGQSDGTIVEGNPMELAILFWTQINGIALYTERKLYDLPMPDYQICANMFFKEKLQ